ncbi:hypothetical protein GLIP_1842 [Aliiglaciecola lipolytica E3]|uniref:Uncharacterized protein n=1 Tax=Aliiglaciecola lipolytica E3 TaxID=1127673 RepID=K6XS13_9ALTE|nr:hypothetical protein GLIP_1842 [Aliiglaciecola lipolytica E3]
MRFLCRFYVLTGYPVTFTKLDSPDVELDSPDVALGMVTLI